MLPADSRAIVEAVRAAILANLDPIYEEGVLYDMIGYYVPHRVYPPGYHCKPSIPLPFAVLGGKKSHVALHFMPVYADKALAEWFARAWAATGKKLDMGKACIRFTKLEDVAAEVLGEAVRRVPAREYIARCEATYQRPAKSSSAARGKGSAQGKAPNKGKAQPKTPDKPGAGRSSAAGGKARTKATTKKKRAARG